MKICAICLSDLHFGSETSVLTAIDPSTPGHGPDINCVSPVLVALVKCIRFILAAHEGGGDDRKPSIVLAGDALELALATTNEAATVFAQFVRLLFDDSSAGGRSLMDPTFVYLPGNHDHHLWETSREHQYANYLGEPETVTPFEHRPWHATHLFPWREGSGVNNRNVESFLLNELVKNLAPVQGAGDGGFVTAGTELVRVLAMYPNFGILGPRETSRCAVIHHGHFTESIYHLMTKLRTIIFPDRPPPEQIWDVEAENYAWIDFFWGTLGRSGGVGKDVEMAYNMLRSKEGTDKLIRNLGYSLPRQFDRRWWAWWFEGWGIRMVLRLLVKRFGGLERCVTGSEDDSGIPLSNESAKLLEEYIQLYVRTQLERECGKGGKADSLDNMNLTFVFGHTHKPFEQIMNVPGVSRPVRVYNAGGWVVDTVESAPSQGGSIVVIDEDGNAASIRMYQQSADRSKYRVRVESAETTIGKSNPLCDRLRELIIPEQSPWCDFSTEAAKAVEERHENMRKIIEKSTQ